MINHIHTALYRAVDQLSVKQAAVIGGVGSSASAVSVLSVDGDHWLQVFTLACGATGAVLSVGLMLLKFIQQRREMALWQEKNDEEHTAMVAQHVVSELDREGLHDETKQLKDDMSDLRRRCELCGHYKQ